MNRPRLHFEIIHLELKHTWTIARGSASYKDNVLVQYARDGITGFGEAGHLTAAGQTAEQTMAGLEKLAPIYLDADPLAYRELPDLAAAVPGVAAPARAAIEMAVLDWVGKHYKLPLHQLFGLNAHRTVPTSFTIGLDTPEVMQQKTREAEVYPILKVKLGKDNDEEIIKALRAVTSKPLRVDANEGWPDKETAIKKIEWLSKQGVDLVEQPLPRRQLEENRWLKERTALPLIADESVNTAKDIPALAGCFSGINIKIMKSGGIVEALRMFEVARAHNLEAMLGCMVESSVAISAAVQLQSLARWIDLDGNLLLKADPFSGLKFVEGRWQTPGGHGLGIIRRT